jgi:hypothetical protein
MDGGNVVAENRHFAVFPEVSCSTACGIQRKSVHEREDNEMAVSKNIHANRKMRLLGGGRGQQGKCTRQRRANNLREVLMVLS